MRISRIAATVVAASALVVSATPAFAGRYVHSDAWRDVVVSDHTDTSVSRGDVTRVEIVHGDRKVLVKIKVRSLDAHGVRSQFVGVKTNEGLVRKVNVTASIGATAPTDVDFTKANNTSLSCQYLRVNYYQSTSVVSVAIPRSCLSQPRWVQVAVGSYETEDGEAIGTDDGLRRGLLGHDQFVLSPRVFRG